MTRKRYVLILTILCGGWQPVHAQTSSLVWVGAGGSLIYAPHANTGQTNAVNTIPDFSFAGYRGGGIPLPNVPVAETVNPVSGDARTVIQSAIDRVSALPLNADGFRGAVLLKSGRYEVNGSLSLKASGVVLRGERQNTSEKGGTELVATSPTQHDFIQLQGTETSLEPTTETVLDTQLFPPARTWQEFDVLRGVSEELDGDNIISFHLTTDANQYVNYASREDSAANRPMLRMTVQSVATGLDSVISLAAVADTYVQGGASAKLNFGAEVSVAVKYAGVNNNVTREGYLRFDMASVKDSVKSAVLRLYAKKDLAGDPAAIKTVNISVSYIKVDSWDEMTLTYDTRPLSAGAAGARRITTPYVPTGATTVEVDSANGFAVGDTIRITRTPNDAWIIALDMAQYGWVASEYKIAYERVVTGISANQISFDVPLVQAIDSLYGGGEVTRLTVKGRLSNCGVEHMLISSVYASEEDESHGWTAVLLSQTTDCWVRKVTARFFGYSCVMLSWAYFSTIEECAMLDPKSITTGSRKYSFYIDKGTFNLFQRCYTRGGRHDFVTGSRVAGPNVFVDGFSTQTHADIGPHHRYATGLLFDNIRGGETRVQNRKAMGSGHGWAGAQTMFWNCQSDVSEFKVESPLGGMNWGIGCSGVVKNGAGFWESWGTRVVPRSLYYQQLQDRLGASAVENVTLTEQRAGSVWPLLIQWAGIGDLATSTDIPPREEHHPPQFTLWQNYPNPFNPTTVIQFAIPVNGRVTLTILNTLGQEVATLYDREAEAGGRYRVFFDASGLASGVYYSRLACAEKVLLRHMVMIK